MKFFGGVEGGATHSSLVICNEKGECVAETTGLGTNHWMLGMVECAHRIADMVERAKLEANIAQETPLASLGLSLSGAEQDATNLELENELRTTFPDLAESYYVASDTVGSVSTASPIGGMVVISGTGSNFLLRNPDGSTFTCGGWGNFLGDEGSAWYISHRAIKTVFDHMDNFQKSPYPIDHIWDLIKQHFNIESRLDLMPHCYAKFDKPFYASFCKKLSHAAENGDKFAINLFQESGRALARGIMALLPNVHDSLVVSGDLNIVCVGSVWLSWDLLKEAFISELDKQPLSFDLKLVRITKSMAFGACYLGTDHINFNLPRNYSDNFTVLYHYSNKHKGTNGVNNTSDN